MERQEWGGVGTESHWILGLTVPKVLLRRKVAWEAWETVLLHSTSCPGNSVTAEQTCWILHMKGEGDGEKVLPFKEQRWQRNSEKAYGIRESKFTLFWVRLRRQAACTGGSPGSCMGSSKPAVSASFLCGARPQPWNRDLPTSANPAH